MDKRNPHQRPRPAITLSISASQNAERKSWLVSADCRRRIVELRGGPQRRPR